MGQAIQFEAVEVAFAGEKIYDGVDFSVGDGEFVCLLGPSGCGKSTSLRIIGDLLEPASGQVRVQGRAPSQAWKEIAFVFQSPRLAPWRTAISNVLLGVELRYGKAEAKQRQQIARQLLELVGLSAAADKYPLMLSGGERQRVAMQPGQRELGAGGRPVPPPGARARAGSGLRHPRSGDCRSSRYPRVDAGRADQRGAPSGVNPGAVAITSPVPPAFARPPRGRRRSVVPRRRDRDPAGAGGSWDGR